MSANRKPQKMSERARSILMPSDEQKNQIIIADMVARSTRAKLVARDRLNMAKRLDAEIAALQVKA